ncbi:MULTISPECIES: YcnI family copper-binding membrane protein [unclassified Isoptericola]|uniref:YcnI family copper-binding membrane protein n=1 Tax=unclassified Isoptericola TaxID=2623355 RepID=UPI0036530CEF
MPTTTPARTRRTRRLAGAAALAVPALLLGAGAASAHVTVTPDSAESGAYATLTFKVPNESPEASTTAVKVTLPSDTPFTSVSVEPVPGWSAKVTRAELPEPVDVQGTTLTEAPASVEWTADDPDAGIAPGEFLRFSVSAGAVPDGVDAITLPTTQTYSDGEVVEWDQEATGDAEPEHPAPVLQVVPATGDDAHGSAAGASAETGSDASAQADDGSGDTLPLALAAAGLGLGLVGAVTGVAALARTRARTEQR